MTQTLAELQRFAVPGQLTIDAGCGGLPRVSVATPLARGEVYLQGGHVTAWQPAGQAPVIWMGSQSWFADGKPIRGGIPVCWPWFGSGPVASAPAHGVARFARWQLDDARIDPDGVAVVGLRLADSATTRAAFDHAFELRLQVRFGRRLEVNLTATNTGTTAFPVGEALHTYLAVGDVRKVAVEGLAGATGMDRVADPKPAVFTGAITVGAETDLLFTGTTGVVTVRDASLGRTLRVAKNGSSTTVVWNPWIAKSVRLADFGNHEWPGMLCVEAANATTDAYQLAPGASHCLGTTIDVI
jgi:glucose-6-phosphate 1-epimerase